MKVFFVADFFKDEILGGAESNDSVLISSLRNANLDVIEKKSVECDLQFLNKNKEFFFIISNFTQLSDACKKFLSKEIKYVIYEHDHKYVSTRDPSKFLDFKIPKESLLNVDFYKKALKVIVLSKICKNILEDNLLINNVISIGTSLWTKDKFNLLRSKLTNQKTKKLGIINSKNPTKGSDKAIQYCHKNNIEFDLITPGDELDFLDSISQYEEILFLPQVLETFCRVVAEAKVLNCKVLTTPKMLGFYSEKQLVDLSGEDLLRELENRTNRACETFKNLILEKEEKITVILNCYRRPQYLKEQIEAVKKQTKKPHEIWIWVNHHKDNENFDFSNLNVDRIFKNDYNWKYYGRFAAAMLSKSKYIALFDDDTIPGSKWFENCLNTMQQSEGIMGGAGVVLNNELYQGHTRFGWSSQNKKTVEVDLVGHAWFFKKEWLKYLWMEDPLTWDNGEDIHFAYTAQKYGNIASYCPPHPQDDIEQFSSLKGYKYGVDDKASSAVRNHTVFYQERDEIVQHSIKNGWSIIKNK